MSDETVTLAQQIAEVHRECGVRRRVYPQWVAAGRMKPEQAARKLAAMDAAFETLRELEAGEAGEP